MRIRKVVLQTSRLADMAWFYGQVLGFRIKNCPGQPASFAVELPQTLLCFEQASGSPTPFYHFAFNIAENQIEQALAWVQFKRITPLLWQGRAIQDFRNWHAHAFYFYDPSGNIVEFIARHELTYTWRAGDFDASSVWSVSEVGLVVEDVPACCKYLHTHWGVPVYYTDNAEYFCAMGNPEGLLIVVKRGRSWFPTEQAAGVFGLELYLDEVKRHEAEYVPSYPYKLVGSAE